MKTPTTTPPDPPFKSGHIAIVGRPNVGKSTLLNALIGQKLSISARRPQTTRHSILGIRTTDRAQMLFVDTPGQHLKTPRALNRYMNRTATAALHDVDAVVLVADRLKWNAEDAMVLRQVKATAKPCLVALNKIDRLTDPALLLPHIQDLAAQLPQAEFVPLSALRKTNLDRLLALLEDRLPAGPPLYAAEQITDRSLRFLAAEIVREKIMRQLGEEVPYAATVHIERYQKKGNLTQIHALILVERSGQKSILIGAGGTRLKQIGSDARRDLERLTGGKVMLKLWAKVRANWSDDDRALRHLGYR
ncbi:MAG: GTPase Era [Cellvibrionales bacterium]|nr:GTPase Era [Cellvibrionales bacterium]